MKKLLIALVVLAATLPRPVHAQEPIYLPVVMGGAMPTCNRTWKLIEPDGTTNEVLNPSAEIAGNFAALPGTTVTRDTTYSKWGLYSYRVQCNAAAEGISLTLQALSNAAHHVTMRVRGVLPVSWAWSLDGATWRTPQEIQDIDDDWTLYGAGFPASEASGSTTLTVRQVGAGAGDFYLDGVQVEAHAYWTTYCDGTREGCEWDGAEHASSSTRSAQSRAGGRVRDFWLDYGFFAERVQGAGAPPVDVGVDGYAVLPGGEVSGVKTLPRQWILVGHFVAESERELHANRQALLQVLSHDTYPEDDEGPQPVRLRYSGAAVWKQTEAHYDGGLEGRLKASYGPWQAEGDEWLSVTRWTERAALRFKSPDPFWREVGESSLLLDSNDSATFRLVAARLRSTGQWDPLGPPAAPGTAVYTYVYAIAEDDTYFYIGGNFQNFNNNGNSDYIVRYNKQTGAWSPLGVGTDNIVRALVIAPDGTLYAGGTFQNAGGGAAFYIAQWDPVAEAWAAVGAGLNGSVWALCVGLDGRIYVGGAFTDLQGGGLAGAQRVACWDPITTTWTAMQTGVDNDVTALATGLDGRIFAGGHFTQGNTGPVSMIRIGQWDGSAWSALEATGLSSHCYALAVASNGILYLGGLFTTAGGVTVNYIATWNGTAYTPLGAGMDNFVYGLSIGPDGMVYAVGNFTQAGPLTLADRAAKWNGSSWAHLDIDFPGTPTMRAVLASKRHDPVIEVNYDLIVGFNSTGTGYFAGTATATNDGTEPAYPVIVVERSGGTSATLEEVRNETTGLELLYDYGLLDGEELTTDLTPTEKSIVSDFFGPRMDAILPGCDFGTWALQPGANQVTAFVATVGGPTVTAYMLWQDTYKSFD